MSHPPHVAAFARLSTDHLPDLHELEDRAQVLWVLTASKADPLTEKLTPANIADILCDVCGIAIARQRVAAILDKEKAKGTVICQKRSGRKYFKIMKRGEDELLGAGLRPLFIDPSKPLSSIRAVEDILGTLEGEVRICDTYVDSRTLDCLPMTDKADSVKLLTENIQDSRRLKRDLAAFAREHSTPVELRVAPPGQLHDRYILHKNGMLFVGASLKDMGKKQSMIVNLPTSFAKEMSKAFDRCWNNANKFS